MSIATTLEEKIKKLSISLLLGLSGCIASHYQLDPNYKCPKPLDPVGIGYYDHTYREPLNLVLEKILDDNEDYTLRHFTFLENHSESGLACVNYYGVKGEGKKPLVLLSPILISKSPELNPECELFAEYFAQNGISAAIIGRLEDGVEKGITESRISIRESIFHLYVEDSLRKSILHIRRVVDFLEKRPEVDLYKIGSFGISMGGIKNCITASIDPRLRVNIFCITAENIPSILVSTTEDSIEKSIKQLQEKYGLSIEDIEKKMRSVSLSDPMHYANSIDARNTLFVMARWDTVAPTELQESLRERIGYPETIVLNSGHYTSALYAFLPWPFNYMQRKSLDFFKRKFGELDRDLTAKN